MIGQPLGPVADAGQRDAIDHPLDGPGVAIMGASGTGKSYVLVARSQRAASTLSGDAQVLLTAASDFAVMKLRASIEPSSRRITCRSISAIAFDVIAQLGPTDHRDLRLIDDLEAAEHFTQAAEGLFSLEWSEFLGDEIDPEITGARAPRRFADAAFRLVRKLRAALIDPQTFLQKCLRGANEFYGHPPNFTHPAVITETQPKYRDSLRVSDAEFARQHARELDLIKILFRLYDAHHRELAAKGLATRDDALAESARTLLERPVLRREWLARIPFAHVDDAQDLSLAETGFLRALFGDELRGVSLAGDARQATRTFEGGRNGDALHGAATKFNLEVDYRSAPAIAAVARRAVDPQAPVGGGRNPAVALYRGVSVADEAAYVADEVARLLAGGVPAQQIAVIGRSLSCANEYIEALLVRDIPLDLGGDVNLWEFSPVEDALAALWALADPFRHDWLLRNLTAPWLRLCDASVAALCSEPSGPQAPLFEFPAEPAERSRSWDRRRELRLARNVLGGDADHDLTLQTHARLTAFRKAHARWEQLDRECDVVTLARLVLDETVFATGDAGARNRFNRSLVERLLAELERQATGRPLATLRDVLLALETAADADDLRQIHPLDTAAVSVLSVEAAKGREFDHVFVVDIRAGAFPRYYSPDAFLFTSKYGIVPKENVGDARAQRTAKFTYVLMKIRARESYNAQERRALACAATRARTSLSLSASGRATRGTASPEILEELRAAGIAGCDDITRSWRPSRIPPIS